jgi:hypothetical protein
MLYNMFFSLMQWKLKSQKNLKDLSAEQNLLNKAYLCKIENNLKL